MREERRSADDGVLYWFCLSIDVTRLQVTETSAIMSTRLAASLLPSRPHSIAPTVRLYTSFPLALPTYVQFSASWKISMKYLIEDLLDGEGEAEGFESRQTAAGRDDGSIVTVD